MSSGSDEEPYDESNESSFAEFISGPKRFASEEKSDETSFIYLPKEMNLPIQKIHEKWKCDECNSNENEISLLKCNQCGSFTKSLSVIKIQIIYSLMKLAYSYIISNKNFIDILKLFKNEQFIKYHSLIKLENLLLYAINLIINMNKIDALKTLFENKV